MNDDATCQVGGRHVRELPHCLDEVIQANRSQANLRLATDDELAPLVRAIPGTDSVDGAISNWRLIMFTARGADHAFERVHVLGDNAKRGVGVKITSPVLALDRGMSLAVTRSGSVYRLIGPPGRDQPTRHQLLLLCAALWSWGHGRHLGVPYVWF